MKRYLLILLLAMSINNSQAQTLGKYADQLYFGMLSFSAAVGILANSFLS